MKYMQTTSYTIKEDFLKNLLIDRGIIPENNKEYHHDFILLNKLYKIFCLSVSKSFRVLYDSRQ